MVVGDGIVGQTDARRGLGNIHRAAAAHGDDEFAMVFPDDFGTGVHFGDVRIRGEVGEHGGDRAVAGIDQPLRLAGIDEELRSDHDAVM